MNSSTGSPQPMRFSLGQILIGIAVCVVIFNIFADARRATRALEAEQVRISQLESQLRSAQFNYQSSRSESQQNSVRMQSLESQLRSYESQLRSYAAQLESLAKLTAPLQREKLVELFGGQEVFRALAAGPPLEAFRLADIVEQPQSVTAPLGGYRVQTGPVKVDGHLAGKLGELFTRANFYEHPAGATDCPFKPGVALRFEAAGKKIELLICFGCNELAVYRDNRLHGFVSIRPRRQELLTVLRDVFPGDQVIAKLAHE